MGKTTEQADFNRNKMEAVFQKRANILARPRVEKVKEDKERLLVFSLGEEHYALKLEELSEVLPYKNYTKIPNSDKLICGVINVRGELYSVVDLKGLLGLNSRDENDKGFVIILKNNKLGLKADRLEHILSFWTKAQADKEVKSHDIPAQYTQAVLNDNIFLLSVEKILTHSIFNGKTF